jgi:hypothetical protein
MARRLAQANGHTPLVLVEPLYVYLLPGIKSAKLAQRLLNFPNV